MQAARLQTALVFKNCERIRARLSFLSCCAPTSTLPSVTNRASCSTTGRKRYTVSASSLTPRDLSFDFESHADLVRALQALQDDPLQRDGGRIVTFRGNPQSKLFIIGEGPGAEEDRLGIPFVGESGQLLDRILASVQLDSESDVYVTNLVKRRPLNNRDPTADEIHYYRPWLEAELRLVNPHVVVLAGRHAMKSFLNEKQGITKVHGQWYDIGDGRWWMPVFHPSYLLRNPQWKPGAPKALMWQDANAIKDKLLDLGHGHSDPSFRATR